MVQRLLKASLLCLLWAPIAYPAHAEALPQLIATNFGSFAARSQTSLQNNNPAENNSYSLIGGGRDLWGAADNGFFAFFPTNGNFDVRVRVESLENVHRYAKSGLMVRESLSSAARMVSIFATPTGPTELPPENPVGENEVEFNYRKASTLDGENNINLGSPGFPDAWLRLARRGNIVYGLVSRDGTNWTQSASVDTSTWTGGPMRPSVLLGLGASSHDDAKLVRTELRDFSQVTSVGNVQILTNPVEGYGIIDSTATFAVNVSDPVDAKYQWLADGTIIPGATNASYTTATLDSSSNQTQYSVRVTGANGIVQTSTAAVLSVVSVEVPDFPVASFDFDDGEVPMGSSIFGTAEISPTQGAGGSGGLILARAANSQNGSFVVEDLNAGELVTSFTAAFKLKIGPGTSRPADGFSFSYGPSIPLSLFPSPQQGVGPGLAISFDIYNNAEGEAPAIDIFYGVDPSITPLNYRGNILHRSMALSDLVTSRYVDVIIRMNSNGKLDLVYNGRVIAYQLQTPFVPVARGRFGFGAYAGGQNAFHGLDDLRIETTTSNNEAYLSSISPLGNNVSASPEIRVELIDMATKVDPKTIQLSLNDTPVTPVVTRNEELLATIVTYSASALLAPLSTNTVSIVWADSAGTRNTNIATFKVGGYISLPGTGTAQPNTNDTGFKVRVFQILTNLTPNSTFAESVLSGQRGENIADLTITDEHGVFVEPSITSVIDYDVNTAPLGLSTFPGIPGLSDSKENFVSEITTFVRFPAAGFYQMGIRSDDGFVLSSGGQILGSFEGEREPADTIFGFVVPQAGVYPFRLLYYQARGGGKIRWFSVTSGGQQIPVNEDGSANALKAYRIASDAPQGPRVSISAPGTNVVISWTGGGVLESATDLQPGGWTVVTNASSSYQTVPSGARRFFRVRQ